jgi:hypothetical protein
VFLDRGDRIRVTGDDRVFRVSSIRPAWKDRDLQVLRVSWVERDGLHVGDIDLVDHVQVVMVSERKDTA